MRVFAYFVVRFRLAVLALSCATAVCVEAQTTAVVTRQVHFRGEVPPGNYSGITHLRGSLYALADDKAPSDGFRLVDIRVDSITGSIQSVVDKGYVASDKYGNRDAEGVAYMPVRGTLLVVGEADSRVVEYAEDGKATGRELSLVPGVSNGGYESLAWDARRGLLWTCTESPLAADAAASFTGGMPGGLIRLQAFDDGLSCVATWTYVTDRPESDASRALNYAFGVSELLPSDTALLVLEREAFVPKKKIGAWVTNKLYEVRAADMFAADGKASHAYADKALPKRLLCRWHTKLTLTARSFANYEGMCWGPVLVDGSRTIILVADSQNQAHGVLRDWFTTVVVR